MSDRSVVPTAGVLRIYSGERPAPGRPASGGAKLLAEIPLTLVTAAGRDAKAAVPSGRVVYRRDSGPGWHVDTGPPGAPPRVVLEDLGPDRAG